MSISAPQQQNVVQTVGNINFTKNNAKAYLNAHPSTLKDLSTLKAAPTGTVKTTSIGDLTESEIQALLNSMGSTQVTGATAFLI